MLDFTKEELIEILDYCNWEPDSLGFGDFRFNIYKKIKFMIDNFEYLATEEVEIGKSYEMSMPPKYMLEFKQKMIISENQIYFLIKIAESYRKTLSSIIDNGLAVGYPSELLLNIDNLLSAIYNQQSEELKVK